MPFQKLLLVLLLVCATAGIVRAQDAGWPRTFTKPAGTLVLYQPQVDDWKQFSQLDARSAFSLTPTGGKEHNQNRRQCQLAALPGHRQRELLPVQQQRLDDILEPRWDLDSDSEAAQ